MANLFGTDGIRGIPNETLTCSLAFRVGQAMAVTLSRGRTAKPTVVVGKDTRASSDMLESALLAGLCACGANAVRLDVLPTAAVAFLTKFYRADAGVMISASHNPCPDNGIKLFSAEGRKFSDTLEAEIEAMVCADAPMPLAAPDRLGRIHEGLQSSEYYIRHLASAVGEISDLRILVDCGNGAASATAQRLFRRFQFDVNFIHDKPDGVNINADCGSTHLESLSQRVVGSYYDAGIAFDGDGDRCIAVDEHGSPINGDLLLALCAADLQAKGQLRNGGIASTVLSNSGLRRFCEEKGMVLHTTPVGGRNVLARMEQEGLSLGGEQSGRLFFRDYLPTADGQLTALKFLEILSSSRLPASKLAAQVPLVPQVLLHVPASENAADRRRLVESPMVRAAVAQAEKTLAGQGRIIVRASGTEARIRVMVEASTLDAARQLAQIVADTVENAQKSN